MRAPRRWTRLGMGAALGLGAVLTPTAAGAQGLALEVDRLRSPLAPAFVLMDVAPETVERPATPRAIQASLLNAGLGGGLLDNYAIQASPYWLRSRPALTLEQFRNAGLRQTFLQSFAVSLATSRFDDEPVPAGRPRDGTRVGGGVRFQLADGAVPDTVLRLQAALKRAQQECLLVEDDGATEACIDRLRLGDLARQVQRLARTPEGFVLEFSGAVVGEFPDSSFDAGRVRRVGVWVTPSWRFSGSALEVIGVGRYFRDHGSDVRQDNVDLGGRLHWEGAIASLSGEALWRRSDGADGSRGDLRTALIAGLHLSDDLHATYSLGRGLPGPDGGDGKLVSTLSVSLGAGRLPMVRIP